MKKLLWIIEDEKAAQFFYKMELGKKYEIMAFLTLAALEDGLTKLLSDSSLEKPELLICDVRLPDGCLLDFIHSSSSLKALSLPLLVVSANDEVADIQKAYSMSIVDYLVKPFNMNELSFKVERFLRENALAIENKAFLELLAATHSVKNKYGTLSLTTKEFQLVSLLLKSSDRTVTKEDIVSNVWHDVSVSGKNMEVQISRLRRKISELKITITFVEPAAYFLHQMDESKGKAS